jgi:hypothetical protein
VFVDNDVIAGQLEQLFASETTGERAWEVTLVDGKLRWSDGTKTWDDTPEASFGRKFQAWVARVLPVSSQL